MSHVLARLLCVAAVAALALPVGAQTPQTESKTTEATPAAGSPTGAATAPAAISQEEKAARAACESKTAADKEKCLKDIEAKYGKSATTDKMAPSGDMSTKPKEDAMKSGSAK